MAEYRIEYTIYRDDEVIGFGASHPTVDVQDAAAEIGAAADNYDWETEGTMPDPEEVRAEIDAARQATWSDEDAARVTCHSRRGDI